MDESIVVSKGVIAEADEEDVDAQVVMIDAMMMEMTKSGEGDDFDATTAMLTMSLIDDEKKREKLNVMEFSFPSIDDAMTEIKFLFVKKKKHEDRRW